MDFEDARGHLGAIRSEEQKRRERAADLPHEAAGQQWVTVDVPFIIEFCLVFLVSIFHHLERRLTHLGALSGDRDVRINLAEYNRRKKALDDLKEKDKWEKLNDLLRFEDRTQYEALQVLRHLSNSYKHDLDMKASNLLLKAHSLDARNNYADLTSSGKLHAALADLVGLAPTAGAKRFLDIAWCFLHDVENDNALSRSKISQASLRTSFSTSYE